MLATLLAASACTDPTEASPPVAVDSTLVNALVDLHLADARGFIHEDPTRADSLRDLVYAQHELDSLQLNQRLANIALRPGAVAALMEAVESQLILEQQEALSSP
ncbi:MAG: hypothetical protein Rubg2KO_10140 [Rubricoccaceae bacterium]